MEVVMVGDSYMDVGNVGPTIQKDANATYRTYYQAGAAMYYGTGQGNIPYQFDSMAVPANADIKVVIMDGGGNDVLINNRSCLSTPFQGDTMCHMVVEESQATALKLLQDMVSKGVKSIVYYFYPHIDPSAGLTGPNCNDWDDYGIQIGAANCCGASNVPQGADSTCEGNGPGAQCVFVDTRPEFVGHNDSTNGQYWFQDGIHPTQPGADAIATKVWAQMQKYCIAQ
jgi:phospholipase/lecithinase/hemolysin